MTGVSGFTGCEIPQQGEEWKWQHFLGLPQVTWVRHWCDPSVLRGFEFATLPSPPRRERNSCRWNDGF